MKMDSNNLNDKKLEEGIYRWFILVSAKRV